MLTPAGGWFVKPQAQIGMPTTFVVEWNGLAGYMFNVPSGRLQSTVYTTSKCICGRCLLMPSTYGWMDRQSHSTTAPTAGGSISYAYNGLGNIDCSSSMAINLNYRLGMYAIGNQRIYPSSLVEIGNNNDYAAATKRVQPFTSIADTSLGVTLDLTGLGSGPYYLWGHEQPTAAESGLPVGRCHRACGTDGCRHPLKCTARAAGSGLLRRPLSLTGHPRGFHCPSRTFRSDS